jgi:hypothetical protein
MNICEAFHKQSVPLFLEYECNLSIALTNNEKLEMAAEMVSEITMIDIYKRVRLW